ncbi:MAG TPA: DoxX family protein [Phnomibacter sp.]|nr:DoxX family protein [Phnomibacter sp.]
MNALLRLTQWGDRHHPRWVDVIRIALGVFLMYKGIDFLIHHNRLTAMLASSGKGFGDFAYMLAGHYVVFAHLLGGLAITLGMFTRAACLLQIPILLGAVFFINTNPKMLQPYGELILSIVVLLLLVYFLVVGNGPLSFKMPDERPRGQ